MGKFGVRSGQLKAQNLQGGSVTVTLDSNGDGTAPVTFDRRFKGTPVVMGTAQEQDITGSINAESVSLTKATIRVDGSAITGATISIGYIAFDDQR